SPHWPAGRFLPRRPLYRRRGFPVASGGRPMADTQLRAAARHVRQLVAGQRPPDQADGELLGAFVSSGDEPAFTQLLKRHGPMVLAACRRVLGQQQDAEDAFQATFLLLAHKAASIRKHESLGSWLHGVAYHMATDARKAAARRRKHEGQATTTRPPADPAWNAAWREVQAILDEEVRRLPAAYREPFILCCLENRACAEVARLLRQKEGTVWSRVARAGHRLRQRLAGGGVSLPSLPGAAAVSGNTALAALPPSLLRSTVRAATHLTSAAGPAGALVSPKVSALLKGMTKTMAASKLKTATPLLLTARLGAAGRGPAAHTPPRGKKPRPPPPPAGPGTPA